MAVTGSIKLSTSFNQDLTNVPGTSAPTVNNQQSIKCDFNSPGGTAADLVDRKYSKTLTLSATPTVLDLKALTAVDGSAVAFVKVRSITVVNRSTTDGADVLVGYATTTANAFTGAFSNPGQLTVKPSTAANSGFLALAAPNTSGYAVSTSSRLLPLDPGSATITVDVEITGTSA